MATNQEEFLSGQQRTEDILKMATQLGDLYCSQQWAEDIIEMMIKRGEFQQEAKGHYQDG